MEKLTLRTGFVLLLILDIMFAGCIPIDEESAEFSMQVMPESIEDSIPGQRCVFLVTVEDEGYGESGEVNISASVEGASVTVEPQIIAPGQVAEVTVVPDELLMLEAEPVPVEDEPVIDEDNEDGREPIQPIEPEPVADETLTLAITGERSGIEHTMMASVVVSGARGPEDLLPTAEGMRDRFIPWLAANHPELGITEETEWIDTVVRPHFFVVMYYLFFSEEWEMGVRWHVMIPPHDWAEIYLRHRTTETVPSYAFKIASLDAGDAPQSVAPPGFIWR